MVFTLLPISLINLECMVTILFSAVKFTKVELIIFFLKFMMKKILKKFDLSCAEKDLWKP